MSGKLPPRLLVDTNILVYTTQMIASAVTFMKQVEQDDAVEVLFSAMRSCFPTMD